MDKKLENEHLIKIKLLHFNNVKSACIEYMRTQLFIKNLSKPNSTMSPIEQAFKYSYYNAYQYIIGTIFAHRLFEIYVQDEISVLQDFRKVATHEITIPELLSKYNISLRNFETINNFQKTLTQITK